MKDLVVKCLSCLNIRDPVVYYVEKDKRIHLNLLDVHDIISYVGLFHDPGICPWVPRTNWEYLLIIHIFRLNLEMWVELNSWHYQWSGRTGS